MDLRRFHLKPGCTYRAKARFGSSVYNAINIQTNENGGIKSFSGTYTCNSPEMFLEMIDLFDFQEILNVTTGESWQEPMSPREI